MWNKSGRQVSPNTSPDFRHESANFGGCFPSAAAVQRPKTTEQVSHFSLNFLQFFSHRRPGSFWNVPGRCCLLRSESLDPQQFEGREEAIVSAAAFQHKMAKEEKGGKVLNPRLLFHNGPLWAAPRCLIYFGCWRWMRGGGGGGKLGLSTQLTSRQLATPIATVASPRCLCIFVLLVEFHQ